MQLELDTRLIAYFDILGYKDAFTKKGFDSHTYLNVIQGVMRTAAEMFENIFAPAVIHVKVFSDNAIIVADSPIDEAALAFALLLSDLQRTLLCDYGVLIRGGITRGEIYMDDTLVFGQGLIDCVTLEGEASYPRIIVDECVADLFAENGYLCAERGEDGRMEIVYLRHAAWDDDRPYGEEEQRLRQRMITLSRENCTQVDGDTCAVWATREKRLKKYRWLLDTYNIHHPTAPIDYRIVSGEGGYLQLQVGEP